MVTYKKLYQYLEVKSTLKFNVIARSLFPKQSVNDNAFSYLVTSFRLVTFLLLILLTISCSKSISEQNNVIVGADGLLSEEFDLIKNKQIGIITNHTAILNNGTHLVDTLFSRDDVKIIKLFAPEHGIRGNAPDGHSIKNGADVKTGLPVISLYGKTRKPTKEMLDSIDVLIFDIQDIGARFYTFISTMYYAIQAAAENNTPIIILDRPNPINGIDVDGPILDLGFKTFVGIAAIPIRHGMTVGELALFFNRPKILGTKTKAKLEIVKTKNWSSYKYFDELNLTWIKPSPNMPTLETALVYPGLCLLEGTNISEGRGTYQPFLKFGSPFINPSRVIKELKTLDIIGCRLTTINFTPIEIPNMSMYPKYKNEKCNGIKIHISNRALFKPIDFAVKLIYVFHKLYPEDFSFRESHFDRLWGSNSLRENILDGKTPNEILKSFENELVKFRSLRKQFLLYK